MNRFLSASIPFIVACGVACGAAGTFPQVKAAVPAVNRADKPGADDKIVIEAWVRLSAVNVSTAASAIRAKVAELGGRVVADSFTGKAEDAEGGGLRVRLPPDATTAFVDFTAALGDLQSRRVNAVDVGKEARNLDLHLSNLRVTLSRLEAMAKRETATMADVLALEKEMTRVRGEIELVEGQKRALDDKVTFSSVDITLVRKAGPGVTAPRAKLHPGPVGFMLSRIGADGLEAVSFGAGAMVRFDQHFSLNLAVFGDQPGVGRTVIATAGGQTYSQLFGNGEREFLNPYIGMRLGYAYQDGSHFVIAGDIGLELVKTKAIQIDLTGRAMAFIGGDLSASLQLALAVTFPF